MQLENHAPCVLCPVWPCSAGMAMLCLSCACYLCLQVLAGTIQFSSGIQQARSLLSTDYPSLSIPKCRPLSPGEVLGCTAPVITTQADAIVFVADGRYARVCVFGCGCVRCYNWFSSLAHYSAGGTHTHHTHTPHTCIHHTYTTHMHGVTCLGSHMCFL